MQSPDNIKHPIIATNIPKPREFTITCVSPSIQNKTETFVWAVFDAVCYQVKTPKCTVQLFSLQNRTAVSYKKHTSTRGEFNHCMPKNRSNPLRGLLALPQGRKGISCIALTFMDEILGVCSVYRGMCLQVYIYPFKHFLSNLLLLALLLWTCKLFSYHPVLLLSDVMKGSIHEVAEWTAPTEFLQCFHRLCFGVEQMLGRWLPSRLPSEVEDILKLTRILAELTLRSYILASLSTNKPKMHFQDKTQPNMPNMEVQGKVKDESSSHRAQEMWA